MYIHTAYRKHWNCVIIHDELKFNYLNPQINLGIYSGIAKSLAKCHIIHTIHAAIQRLRLPSSLYSVLECS